MVRRRNRPRNIVKQGDYIVAFNGEKVSRQKRSDSGIWKSMDGECSDARRSNSDGEKALPVSVTPAERCHRQITNSDCG